MALSLRLTDIAMPMLKEDEAVARARRVTA
jgi:hypothetical protein